MTFALSDSPLGVHPPTAALARILCFNKVICPVTEALYSEAMLLGIGGGLDTGYILYKFRNLVNPLLLLGFRNQWNNTSAFIEDLAERLMLSVNFSRFEDNQSAQRALQNALKNRKQAIVWVDKASLPYHHLPGNLVGYINHQVAVYARDGRRWRLSIDDLSKDLFQIREKIFTSARENLSQNNYLMMTFNLATPLNSHELCDAIQQGLASCALQLTRPVNSIGISNLETWAEKLIDRNDPQGWPHLFKNNAGLFPVLKKIYESIKLNGTEGFALRKMYADFLQEAAEILKNPSLNAVAGQYLQLANHWSNLAENALPSKFPNFDRVKSLLNKKYQAYRKNDWKSYQQTISNLKILEEKIVSSFPLNDLDVSQLFNRLSSQVKLISELEHNAAHRLRDITRK
jgi:hypothetical protein